MQQNLLTYVKYYHITIRIHEGLFCKYADDGLHNNELAVDVVLLG